MAARTLAFASMRGTVDFGRGVAIGRVADFNIFQRGQTLLAQTDLASKWWVFRSFGDDGQ